ncbi:MAG: hypothetical protein IJZ74_08135 [Clostridia bacterium]|nr:hypothetical protein [Clostridia bacterium]
MKRIIVMLLAAALCTSCTALPAEERAFAVALGVSRDDGLWRVYARIPTYQTGGGYTTISAEGKELTSAMTSLDAAAPMHLHLDQLRLLIFAEGVARTIDFPSAIAELAARHDIRHQTAVAVTDADMQQLMDDMKPATGTRLSKSIDVLLETRVSQGTAPASTLAEVIRMGERQDAVLMRLQHAHGEWKVSGGCPVGQDGIVREVLSAAEMQLLTLMTGGMKNVTLTLEEGTVRVMDVSADTELSTPTMQSAAVHITLRYTSSSLTDEALSRAVASACLGVLNRLSAANCDALGLGRQAIMHMKDMAEWHELDWQHRYPEIEWSVSVGVQPAA